MKVSSNLASLWAKKDAYQGREWWLPLITHLTDTSKVIVWLYDHWLSPAQRQLIAGDCSGDAAKQLLAFVGFFHDFGKATPDFQAKMSYRHDQQLDHDIMEKLLHNGFTDLADFNRADEIRRKSPHAIAGETLLEAHGLCEAIGAILGGHHGIPTHKNFDAVQDQLEPYTSNYFSNEKNAEAKEHWQAVYNQSVPANKQIKDSKTPGEEAIKLLNRTIAESDNSLATYASRADSAKNDITTDEMVHWMITYFLRFGGG